MIVVERCIFCGAERLDEMDCLRWNKTVCLRPNPITVTVCPECRELFSVEDLFSKMRAIQSRAARKGNLGGVV